MLGRGKRGRRRRGLSPFAAGLILLAVMLPAIYFGFTKSNPFANPFELKATFASANNLKPRSPVRIAGVNVGKVTNVEPVEKGSGAALVTMEIDEAGLPIHEDAEMKIRPRIFLEGNFFVDVEPGSPSAEKVEAGEVIPMNQTATPVQFGEVLAALQSDTRSDLQTFLREYAKAIDSEGGDGFNRSIRYWEPAYKNTALVNEALFGTQPGDLQRVLRGQQRTFAALARNEDALKGLVTNLNTTAGAFAREDEALAASLPALVGTLRVGSPALKSVNDALPSLRAFAREALPGVRSAGPTIDAALPFIRQARRLVGRRELRGLVRDLRPTVPQLVRLNRAAIGLSEELRALSSCQNRVLVPFAREPIPDPEFPASSNENFVDEAGRALVGLSGEYRVHDSNSPIIRASFGTGPLTTVTGFGGDKLVGTSLFPLLGVRPLRPDARPAFRPGVPCETQEVPDLNAVSGRAERSVPTSASALRRLTEAHELARKRLKKDGSALERAQARAEKEREER